jgi:hypothetical protein
MNRKNPWTLERLNNYIGQEETYQLEFKSSRGLLQTTAGEIEKTFNDLSTHISAFLNSDGGLLVIGIEESDKRDKKQAGKAVSISDGIPRSQWIGDRIQSKLCDRIQPSVASLVLVNTVVIGKHQDEDLLAFVIEVRQGITAYQAADKKYYCRRSFSSEPMDDKDVRLRMLADNTPRLELFVDFNTSPVNQSWESYEKQFYAYVEAKERLSKKTPLDPEIIREKLILGTLKVDPDATIFPPKKLNRFQIRISIKAKNSGTVSIKRACIQYKMPNVIRTDFELRVFESELDVATPPPYSMREIIFDQSGKIMLYPEMIKDLFELMLEVPAERAKGSFTESAEFVVYLDGGSPAHISIDLNDAYATGCIEFEEKINALQINFPSVKID